MNREQPRIGVTSSLGGGRYMWWFYWLSMNLMGARPERLVAPVEREIFSRYDGFIIGGGDDIGAELYRGEAALDVRIDPERDAMELAVLGHAARHDLPVLGVCRGAQMINVFLEGTLLKPNMVLAGKECPHQAPVAEIARATVRCLRRSVPPAVPGIVFLSGGQTPEESTERLSAMNAMGKSPWELSFSYGRALQEPVLAAWRGIPGNVPAAQKAFYHRTRCNGAARYGKYSRQMESEAA